MPTLPPLIRDARAERRLVSIQRQIHHANTALLAERDALLARMNTLNHYPQHRLASMLSDAIPAAPVSEAGIAKAVRRVVRGRPVGAEPAA